MAFLHGAVPDPRSTGDLLDPLLAAGIDGERGLQQLPLQFQPRLGDLRLPVPVIQDASLSAPSTSASVANCPTGQASAAASSSLTGHALPSPPVIVTVTETASSIAGPPSPAGGSFPSTIPAPARKPAEPPAGQRQAPLPAARRHHVRPAPITIP